MKVIDSKRLLSYPADGPPQRSIAPFDSTGLLARFWHEEWVIIVWNVHWKREKRSLATCSFFLGTVDYVKLRMCFHSVCCDTLCLRHP